MNKNTLTLLSTIILVALFYFTGAFAIVAVLAAMQILRTFSKKFKKENLKFGDLMFSLLTSLAITGLSIYPTNVFVYISRYTSQDWLITAIDYSRYGLTVLIWIIFIKDLITFIKSPHAKSHTYP